MIVSLFCEIPYSDYRKLEELINSGRYASKVDMIRSSIRMEFLKMQMEEKGYRKLAETPEVVKIIQQIIKENRDSLTKEADNNG